MRLSTINEDNLPESEEEVSKLREENKILQDKLLIIIIPRHGAIIQQVYYKLRK